MRRRTTTRGVIPALAGNSSSAPTWCAPRPVHPRAGGELATSGPGLRPLFGSSPRGRGTPVNPIAHRGGVRFIPARAGNSPPSPPSARPSTVHPRAGGELHQRRFQDDSAHGSSPRGRGTLRPAAWDVIVRRFIPARAGNSISAAFKTIPPTVHPRAGGELPAAWPEALCDFGSSPRGRGTRGGQLHGSARRRFIPARAGNSLHGRPSRAQAPVHPRAGGELELNHRPSLS